MTIFWGSTALLSITTDSVAELDSSDPSRRDPFVDMMSIVTIFPVNRQDLLLIYALLVVGRFHLVEWTCMSLNQ